MEPGQGEEGLLGQQRHRCIPHRNEHRATPAPAPGTSLGDPIEVGAILAVLGSSSAATQPAGGQRVLKLSAAKSSLGHAEPAAGAIGMLRSMHR